MSATALPRTLGERIKFARKSRGLSHDKLGAMVGTSRQHLIRLEKNVHQPREGLLERIAEATDTDLAFFTGKDDSAEDDEESSLPLTSTELGMLADLMGRLVLGRRGEVVR